MLMKDLKRVKLLDLVPEERDAVALALKVRENAYAPYSEYKVGVVVADTFGEMYAGVNAENHIYKVPHAEEIACGAMLTAGRYKFDLLVCASANGGIPCGSCLQIIREYADDDLSKITIIGARAPNPTEVVRCTFEEAIQVTDSFGPGDLVPYVPGLARFRGQMA